MWNTSGSVLVLSRLVDKARCWTNRSYLTDFIDFPISPKRIDISVFKQLYVEKGLSAAQIAEMVGVSKQMVLARIRRAGIHRTTGRGRSPDNFRYPEPPFGQKVVSGRLVTCSTEIRVVRLILRLRDTERKEWSEIVSHLNSSGFVSRRGFPLTRIRVKRIHTRWGGKL